MKNIFLSFAFSLLIISCGSDNKPKSGKLELPEPKFKKEGSLIIVNEADTLASFDIEIADNDRERQQGLMYRKSMKDNHAMLFIMDKEEVQRFYMKNTYIPLDLLFFDENKNLVYTKRNAKPLDISNISSSKPAKYVLEINGGLASQLKIFSNAKFILQ